MSIENRMAAKKRAQKAKAKRTRRKLLKIIGICLIPIILCLIGLYFLDKHVEKKAASDRYLNADGTIDASKATSYVNLPDYKNISFNRDDLLGTESEVLSKVDSSVAAFTETVTEAGTEIKKDSSVNITYTVKAEGEEIKDLSSEGRNYTLGEGTLFGEEFDEKITALKVGDSFDFDITFDASYANANLAGKTANFSGKVNSVKVVPELTDAFVADKLAAEMGDSE